MRRRLRSLDHRLGRIWSRIGGYVFLGIGLFALMSLIESEGFTPATHWPGLAITSLFFFASAACFRSKAGLIDTISDNAPDRKR